MSVLKRPLREIRSTYGEKGGPMAVLSCDHIIPITMRQYENHREHKKKRIVRIRCWKCPCREDS